MPNHRILITGSNGLIGDALMQHLFQNGFEVCGALRTPLRTSKFFNSQTIDVIPSHDLGYCVVGNISEQTDWSQALQSIDVVIHTAACVHQMQGSTDYDLVNHLGTSHLAKQAAQAGVKRFIFLSSIKVIGEQGHFDYITPCHPQDEYGQSKQDAEQKLMEISKKTGMEYVILRLPLIYGPGVKANFRKLIQLVKQCCLKNIPIPFKGVNNARSMMGLRNLVSFITCCINHPNAAGKIYLPSDGAPISTPELMKKMARVLGDDVEGKPIRMFFVPTFLLKLGFGLIGKKALADRLLGDLTVDNRQVEEDLSWKVPYTVDEELRYTIDAFAKNC